MSMKCDNKEFQIYFTSAFKYILKALWYYLNYSKDVTRKIMLNTGSDLNKVYEAVKWFNQYCN